MHEMKYHPHLLLVGRYQSEVRLLNVTFGIQNMESSVKGRNRPFDRTTDHIQDTGIEWNYCYSTTKSPINLCQKT